MGHASYSRSISLQEKDETTRKVQGSFWGLDDPFYLFFSLFSFPYLEIFGVV